VEVPFGVFAVGGEGIGLAQPGSRACRSEPEQLQLRRERDRVPSSGAVLGAADGGLDREPGAEESTLRGLLAATELGYTSLVVSHRNTTEGPRVGTGRTTLGHTETSDVDEAIGYAVRRGAQQVVLFGWSMGAAIALQLADHPRHDGLIAALVLDSPVLNWTEVIKTNCVRSGLPAAAGHLAIPWLTLHPPPRAVGLLGRIPLHSFDWTARSADLTTPTLILHGTRDDSVPIQLSQALRHARPDFVELETFDAGHTLCWNADPDRWQNAVTTWLKARVPR